MKKQIGIFTAILFAVSAFMVGCKAEVHTHTFAEEWSSDETNHWHAATCGCSDVELQKTEHTFGKWKVIKEPTEEAEGSREKSCTVCEYTVPEVIEKLEHKHKFATDWTNDETNHWHAATCRCSDVELQKTEHTFGEWKVIKEATEDAKGSKERVCDICKCKETAEIAQLNHKHVAGESWKTDDKNHWKECTGCKEKLESAEHEYEWTVTKDETCTDEGSETGVCKVCKKEVTEKIDAKGHSYSGSWTNDASGHWYECVCGANKDFEEHTYDIRKVLQEPTCTQEGKKIVYCTVCEYEKEGTIPVKEHTLGIWTVTKEPKETEVGQMQSECEVCEETVTKGLQPVPEGFVLVKAGSFQMGSNYDNRNYEPWKPVHEVTITKPFYMGKYEVTQAEYEKYCSYGSFSPSSSKGDKYPAYGVSWYDALVYCNKRSITERLTPCYSIDGSTNPDDWGSVPTSSDTTWDAVECNWNVNGYRLPTEAEWEYAARAGDNTVDSLTYSGTNDVNKLGEYAWYNGNSSSKIHEVGTKLPNAYGFFDMSGNVWEWCWNWFTDSYDTTTEGGDNPTGTSAGSDRVYRGGSWYHVSSNSAVSCRTKNSPSTRISVLGFRVVRQAN